MYPDRVDRQGKKYENGHTGNGQAVCFKEERRPLEEEQEKGQGAGNDDGQVLFRNEFSHRNPVLSMVGQEDDEASGYQRNQITHDNPIASPQATEEEAQSQIQEGCDAVTDDIPPERSNP